MIDRLKEPTQYRFIDGINIAVAWTWYDAVVVENFQGHRLMIHHVGGGMLNAVSWGRILFNGAIVWTGSGRGAEVHQDFAGDGGFIFNQPGIIQFQVRSGNIGVTGWGTMLYTVLKKTGK